jgi:hypothetical protein
VRLPPRSTLLWAVTAAIVVVVVAIILWAIFSPHPDRSGTVVAKRAYPETTKQEPMLDPTLDTISTHTIVSGPDWVLTVRRPSGQTVTVRVRRTVYEGCRVGDFYDGTRRMCRP